jgi:hypothetical protein
MGIGDFGVSGTNYYAYNTTEFLGVFAYNHIDLYNGGTRDFTVQLNVVLNFINGGKNYSYWIQDVAEPTDSSQDKVAMSYVDNIWNFSSTSPGTMTGLSGKGQTSGTGSSCYYYDVASGTGSVDTINAPNYFELLVVASQNAQKEPVVAFEFKDPTMSSFTTYDSVTFTDFKKVTLDRGFFVDGFDMNPIDLFEDAEITIGGPGGGSATITEATTELTTSLYFWTGHDFQAVRSAQNFGSDTAEATSSDQSIFGNDGSGTPWTVELNGTTRDATPGQAYTEAQVGTLLVSAATVPTGKIVVHAMPCFGAFPLVCTDSYQGGLATLTLVPGTYHVWDNTSNNALDLGMCTITAGATLTVTLPSTCSGGGTPLTMSSFAASPNPVATGNSVTFTVTTSGGTAPIYYNYTGLPSGCSTSNAATFSCSPTLAGTYYVNATANDSAGTHTTKTITLTVTAAQLTLSSFVASPNPVVVGNTVTFTVTASGGSPPLAYAYSGLPPGCTSQALSTFSCTPTTWGTYSVNATVNDSASGHVYSIFVLTVSPAPLVISAFTAEPNPVAYGSSVAFDVSASGGAAPLKYAYTGLPAGCSTQDLNSFSCSPTAVGTFPIIVTVTDSKPTTPATATMETNLTVTAPALTITSFTANPTTVTLSQPGVDQTNLTVVPAVAAGTTTYTYSYTSSPSGSGCVSANAARITCTPTTVGTYTVEVTVTDSYSSQAFDNVSFTVSLPAAPVLVSFIASPSSITLGQNTTLHVKVTGGLPLLTYIFGNLPAGCKNQSTNALACTPTASGHFNITVIVRDGAGRETSPQAVALYVMIPPPAITGVTLTASPLQVTVGSSVEFTVAVSGGTNPYTYVFSGLPTGCSNPGSIATFYCSPSSAGSYTVTVNVTDFHGKTGTASVTVTVSNAPSTGFLGLSNTDWLLLLLVIVVVVAVIAAVVVRRRRTSEEAIGEQQQYAPAESYPGPAYPVYPPQGQMPPGAMGQAAPAAVAGGMIIQCPACGAGVVSGEMMCSRCGNPMVPT